ncbi:MAG: glycosyltransferase family 2 protein [bacterium]|nr:glycosyltransferase family 2 protein [bacterium]
MIYICLPAYNEEKSLPKLFDKFIRLIEAEPGEYRIILVNDGSRDRTQYIAEHYQSQLPLEIVTHPENRGLGEAIKTAFKAAITHAQDDDIIVNLDADNTHDPNVIPRLIEQITAGADIVIASRYQPGSNQIGVPVLRRICSWGARYVFRFYLPIKSVKDYTCGYRAYRARLIKQGFAEYGDALIEAKGFACTDELLIKLSRLTTKISEVPFILRYDLKDSPSKINIPKTVFATLKLLWKNRR